MSTLTELWEITEQKWGQKTAVTDGQKALTYGQLGEQIRRISWGMRNSWNLDQSDTVALCAPNCYQFIAVYFAAVRLGLTVVPLDPALSINEMQLILSESGTRHLVIHGSLQRKIEELRTAEHSFDAMLGIDCADNEIESYEDWLNRFPEGEPLKVCSDQAAELMYTSGTTGRPKGVVRSHGNVLAAAANSVRGFGYQSSDVILISMPLTHSSALNSQMVPLIETGGTIVLLDRFDRDKVLDLIESHKVTCMRAVPAMLRLLLTSLSFSPQELPSLRLIVNSSAPIDSETFRTLRQRFPDVQVLNSYGLTEASTCTVLSDTLGQAHPDSIGAPIEGVEMCIKDEHGQLLGEDLEGEICVRGPHLFLGYRNCLTGPESRLVEGWFHTGDLGHRDKRGLYYLHGRLNEVINCGGRKFCAGEVEECILGMAEIEEAMVAGSPHRILGQVAKAFVVLRPGALLEAKSVIRHCARLLPSHKIPFTVEFRSELPRNSVGKSLRRPTDLCNP